jgi:hypothetical protein
MDEQPETKREKLVQPLVFLLFSVFFFGYWFYRPPTFSTWQDWIIVGGAVFCPIMAIFMWVSIPNTWSAEKEDQAFMQTLGYLVLVPILLVLAVIAGFALFSTFGWLATIPSWAAIITILLVLIYLKK